jgi:hypothetical protein
MLRAIVTVSPLIASRFVAVKVAQVVMFIPWWVADALNAYRNSSNTTSVCIQVDIKAFLNGAVEPSKGLPARLRNSVNSNHVGGACFARPWQYSSRL